MNLFTRWKARLAAEKDKAERELIAQVFNDRYTYRRVYVEGKGWLGGSFYGCPHQAGYAWMCPECNQIHHPMEDSVFTGLQYPKCCSTPAGDRLRFDIKTQG